ncbi:DUF4872 domain-containing protein [Actinoplanes siamensis]|uniref:DUF4872 domain-containing protein n=1 Tax=Actinoplanes siamensis TaxID=1223317 RepID=A0A919N9R2_9ACTN|nr:DUF4872 domain-containing protein [Actinoplanes siamensis]GIF06901.1 hypothetical protein Asi03nite_44390 [Actinoplanes siamensis]
MPREKNFKALVRSRMAKTGESYTTARSRLERPGPAPAPIPADPDAAALARAMAAVDVVNPLTGQPFSEALLFGLAGGVGFAYLVFTHGDWTTVHLDGRSNALYFEKKSFVEVACARIGVPLRVRPLADRGQAERWVREALAKAPEVALTLDLVKLPARGPVTADPYQPRIVTVSGGQADLAVTGLPWGRVSMGWSELLDARWTGAKKYGGLHLVGRPAQEPDVRPAVVGALARTADCLLEPARSSYDVNFGVPGIRKWARLLTDPKDRKGWSRLWSDRESLAEALASVVRGLGSPTSSGASRRQYAAFLDEAGSLLAAPALAAVARAYRELGERWTALVTLAREPGVTAADLAEPLPDLADAEEAAALSLRASATALTRGAQR